MNIIMVFFHHNAIIIFIFFMGVFLKRKQGLFATFFGKRSHDFETTLRMDVLGVRKKHKKMGNRNSPFFE